MACPSLLGTIRTTSLPFISTRNEQPTPQYAQVVITLWSGCPRSTIDFSTSVAVGHACTQAPHDTHSESRKLVGPLAIFDAKPRPCSVSAKVPWMSSQARTQREQAMHLPGSKSKYGLLVSFVLSLK